MNFFILIGPPGSGKGTQSNLLCQRLGFTHVSTGDIIRREINNKTNLGKSVKKIVESGHFVDDKTVFKCFSNHIDSLPETAKKVIILDGIPRNIAQSIILEKLYPESLKSVLALSAKLEELVERFQKRWFCKNCSQTISLNYTPNTDTVCPHCGKKSQLIRRKDDDPSIVRERLNVYINQTATLIELYSKRGILYEFNALDSVEKIYVRLANLILQKINESI